MGDKIYPAMHGSKIVLEPVQIVTRTGAGELTRAQKRQLDACFAEGLADIKAGRVHGPFGSAKGMSAYVERTLKQRKATKKPKRAGR